MPLEHSDLSRMLEVAVVAARLAGQRAMEEIKYVKTEIKNGNEIVTSADPVCQKLIIDRIKETYPDHGFLAEEGPDGKQLKQPPRSAQNIWWVIDPIDGTNNYANGLLSFCVSIAVLHDGIPIVGVIFEPATDSMFTAATDTDAQLNNSKITVSDDAINEFASFAIDSHYTDEMAGAIEHITRNTRFRCFGSTAMHLAYVAKGALVGAVTTHAKLWDIAAGAIIVQNAGGVMIELSGKAVFPVDVGNYNGENYPTLTTNKRIHDEAKQLFNA